MWALERPWAPRRTPLLAGTPFELIAVLGVSWLVVACFTAADWLPAPCLRIASLTGAHGGLLAVALTWDAADAGIRLPRSLALIPFALIGVGTTAAALDPRAAVALVATPAWLALLAVRRRLGGLALRPEIPVRPLLVGGAIGVLLGGHLLFSASQTLGHPLRGVGWQALLILWAYDVGANIISAECFFRGALFNRLQRRWSFGAAAALATGLSLVRYVADPLLPRQVEVMAGALFYLTLLGAVNCWLLWWSGSLVPGLLTAALFFLAYRALVIG